MEGIKDISHFLSLDRDINFCMHVADKTRLRAMREREQQVISPCTFLNGKEGFVRKGN